MDRKWILLGLLTLFTLYFAGNSFAIAGSDFSIESIDAPSVAVKGETVSVTVDCYTKYSGTYIIYLNGRRYDKYSAVRRVKSGDDSCWSETIRFPINDFGTYSVALLRQGEDIHNYVEDYIKINEQLASSSLTIKSNPSGAKLYIDGSYIGTTPETVELKEGLHKIVLKKDGYLDLSTDLGVAAGLTFTKTYSLTKELTTGTMRIDSNPDGASVKVDGNYVGRTPYEGDYKPGTYKVLVYKDGYLDKEGTVIVQLGKVVSCDLKLTELAPPDTQEPSWIDFLSNIWAWILGLFSGGSNS